MGPSVATFRLLKGTTFFRTQMALDFVFWKVGAAPTTKPGALGYFSDSVAGLMNWKLTTITVNKLILFGAIVVQTNGTTAYHLVGHLFTCSIRAGQGGGR